MNTNEASHRHTRTDRIPTALYTPNGKRIVAAKDWIPGNALILSATRNPDGTFEIEWEGETKICWNGQYTERLGGQRIFLDDDANEWRENELSLGSEPPVAQQSLGSGNDPWGNVPHCELGETPDSLIDRDPVLHRRIIAKRAILAAYEDTDDPQQCIADLLGDLRHLCDALGLDFSKNDRTAYQRYAAEKSTTSA